MASPFLRAPGGFRSITTRIIFWVLLASGAVFLTAVAVSSRLSRSTAGRAAEQEAQSVADAARHRVLAVLESVEKSTALMSASIETLHPASASLDELLHRFVAGNLNVYGSTASFEPYALDPRREHAAPYVYRNLKEPGQYLTADLSLPTYRYWERDWYRGPMDAKEPRWSEPYLDEGGGGTLMVTYAVPIRQSGTQTFIGVVTADLQLDWMRKFIGDVRMGQTGYAVMLSRTGRVIAHPDATMLEQTAARTEEARQRLAPLIGRMQEAQQGFAPIDLDGRRYRVVFRPVSAGTGWSMAALYPEDELMADARRLSTIETALAVGGLGLLASVVVIVSRRLTAPLQELSARARHLATGDLDHEIPLARTRDEMGALTDAFRHMRDSLKEHIQNLKEATAAKERLASELRLARRIQMSMLPSGTGGGLGQGFEVAAKLEPARSVGGDFYMHFVERGRAHFMLGDVSGKGIGAALFMARTKTLFDALALNASDPAALLVELNRRLCAENEQGMFVTGVCGVLNPESGELYFASAGHDPPLRVRPGAPPEPLIVDGGPVLGLLEGSEYPLNHTWLSAGECLLIFTDGVTDAADVRGVLFGPERLLEAVARTPPANADALTKMVFSVVQEFAQGAPQADDITVLSVRFVGQS